VQEGIITEQQKQDYLDIKEDEIRNRLENYEGDYGRSSGHPLFYAPGQISCNTCYQTFTEHGISVLIIEFFYVSGKSCNLHFKMLVT